VPTAYIPTSGGAQSTSYDECYVDWSRYPGPPAGQGKVEVTLLPGADIIGVEPETSSSSSSGAFVGESYAAFRVEDDECRFIRVFGETGETEDGERSLTWKLEGCLPDGSGSTWTPELSAPDPILVEENKPVTVAVRWYRKAVELWVEGEVAGRCAPDPGVLVRFGGDPTRCQLMRDTCGEGSSSSSTACPGDGHEKWIGACKEIRWWK
jgi:hypothetical protein